MALISFDLDGVLQKNPFRSGHDDGVFGRIKRAIAPHVNPADPDAGAAEALRLVLTEHTARMERGDLVGSYDWDDMTNVVARQLGYQGEIPVSAWAAECCQIPGLIDSYAGSNACLEALQAAGHTVVSITNGFRCYQEPVLRGLGLWEYFTTVITPEAVGFAKPEPGIYRSVEHLGAPRIHVGDTLPHDVAGAKRSGWLAIWIVQPGAPGYKELPPELAALPPWERPAAAGDWWRERLERDRKFYTHPPVTDDECRPDAIVHSLREIPATVTALLSNFGA